MPEKTDQHRASARLPDAIRSDLVSAVAAAALFLGGCTFLYYRESVLLRLPASEERLEAGAYEELLAGRPAGITALLYELQERDAGHGAGDRFFSRLKDAGVTLFMVTGGKAPYPLVLRKMLEVLSVRSAAGSSQAPHPLDLSAVLEGRNRECLAFTLVYLLLGRRSGLPLDPVITRGHIMALYDDGVNRLYVDTVRGLLMHSRQELGERFFGSVSAPEPYLRPLSDVELAAVILANRAVISFDEEEALKDIEAATALFPGLPLAWVNRGFLLAKAGRPEGARDAYDRALKLDPENPYALNGLAHMMLNPGNRGMFNPGKARTLLERALFAGGEVPAFIRASYKEAQRLCETETRDGEGVEPSRPQRPGHGSRR